MGLFDSLCAESGLIIHNTWRGSKAVKLQRLIVIREDAGAWSPIALPIAGTNDRGGTMDVPRKLDANAKAIAAFGRRLAYADATMTDVKKDLAKGLEGMLAEIRGDGGGATFDDDTISFSLIDGGVFEAIVDAVAGNGATAWRRFAQVALGTPELPLPNRQKPKAKARRPKVAPPIKKLADALLDDPEDKATRSVFVDSVLEHDPARGRLLAALPKLAKLPWTELFALAFPAGSPIYDGADTQALKPQLVELVRFLAWGTVLSPAHGEGQFTGYVKDDYGGGVQPYVERARTKYAGMPELLAVCDAHEAAFRERDGEEEEEEEEEDEDDDG